MMYKIKSCPFCGYDSPEPIEARSDGSEPTFAVRCPKCGTGIFRARIVVDDEAWEPYNSMDEAVKAWTRRPS